LIDDIGERYEGAVFVEKLNERKRERERERFSVLSVAEEYERKAAECITL
jgi:hypothetical protein